MNSNKPKTVFSLCYTYFFSIQINLSFEKFSDVQFKVTSLFFQIRLYTNQNALIYFQSTHSLLYLFYFTLHIKPNRFYFDCVSSTACNFNSKSKNICLIFLCLTMLLITIFPSFSFLFFGLIE
jgi:hypothetical protein